MAPGANVRAPRHVTGTRRSVCAEVNGRARTTQPGANGGTRNTAARIEAGDASLEGELRVPQGARGLVAFAHGSGSSRHSPRNQRVARALEEAGFGTLLFDLLTPDEGARDARTRALRFDVALLTRRLAGATDWLRQRDDTRTLALGYFGASTGAAAALAAAAERPQEIGAVVSRGGRPDLAGAALERVRAPTLLVVGENDPTVLALNREAQQRIPGEPELSVVPGATHLFEEAGALDEVARRAHGWFDRHLTRNATQQREGEP